MLGLKFSSSFYTQKLFFLIIMYVCLIFFILFFMLFKRLIIACDLEVFFSM